MLAGFDQQIMRNLPPPHELVQKGSPIRGLAGEGGNRITIDLPDLAAPAATAGNPATAPGGEEEEPSMPSTTDLMDERPDDLDVCEIQLRQFGGVRRFAGPVRTVRCVEDNVLLRRTLETSGAGQVLVVDGGGSMRTALLGDMIGALAVANGWAGIVIHGCVRDTEALATLPIGIKALGSNPRKSAKAGAGEVDVVVAFGGATFTPGAWLTSDEDGVVVTRGPTEG
jgi:regulator of ribonuclease activity A